MDRLLKEPFPGFRGPVDPARIRVTLDQTPNGDRVKRITEICTKLRNTWMPDVDGGHERARPVDSN
jgi:hypothetical protein